MESTENLLSHTIMEYEVRSIPPLPTRLNVNGIGDEQGAKVTLKVM